MDEAKTDEFKEDGDEGANEGQPLCPQCLEDLDPIGGFCTHCGSPVGSFAAIGPLERIDTMGWVLRREVSRPSPRIVIVGFWLICSLYIALALLVALGGMAQGGAMAFFFLLIGMIQAYVLFKILMRVTLNSRKPHNGDPKEVPAE